jgi:NADH-quinone oxidoreductase subunit M
LSIFLLPLWIHLTAALPLAAALLALCLRSPVVAARWSNAVLAASLGSTVAIFAAHSAAPPGTVGEGGAGVLAVDDIASPMMPVVVLIHLLTMLGTAKARISTQFCARLLLSAGGMLVALTAVPGALLVGALAIGALLPWWDLRSRGRRTRGYCLHMGLFLALLLAAWQDRDGGARPAALLMLAVLLRGGVVPLHGWLPPLFQNAAFGSALVFVLPLAEVLAALRMLLPVMTGGAAEAGRLACLLTALYGGGMAIVQDDSRRFFAHISLSQTALVLYAALQQTSNGLTAALCLWISAPLSLAGLAFSLRALEARFGSLSLREHHGFYEQVPGLAICFIITGLGSVGFPGTIGFVPMELLVSGSIERSLWTPAALAVVAMMNAIAIMRAYFALFTGRSPATSISLRATLPERAGIVIISMLVFLGGWFSPSVVESRHRTANRLLGAPVPPAEAAPHGNPAAESRPSRPEQPRL